MKIPAHIFPQLEHSANQAIDTAFNTHLPGYARQASSEPDFVAAFVLFAAPQIARAWAALLQPEGITLNVTGVFCHQSPMVRFDAKGHAWPPPNPPARCELADLLIVHDERINGTVVYRRAALIQAKKTMTGFVGAPDPVQYHLYNRLPPFEIIPKRFDRGPRDFGSRASFPLPWNGMQYGLIQDTKGRPASWHMHWPSAPLRCAPHRQLYRFMTDMLVPTRFAGREADPTGTDDWDKTIRELLNITAHRQFRLKSLLGSRRARAGSLQLASLWADGSFCEFESDGDSFRVVFTDAGGRAETIQTFPPEAADNLIAEFGGLFGGERPPPGESPEDSGPGTGVSTLHIETDQEG